MIGNDENFNRNSATGRKGIPAKAFSTASAIALGSIEAGNKMS